VDSRESADDDGSFLFARYLTGKPEETVLVGFNLSQKPITLRPTLPNSAILEKGTVLERIPLRGVDPAGTKPSQTTVTAQLGIELLLPADSVSLWRVKAPGKK